MPLPPPARRRVTLYAAGQVPPPGQAHPESTLPAGQSPVLSLPDLPGHRFSQSSTVRQLRQPFEQGCHLPALLPRRDACTDFPQRRLGHLIGFIADDGCRCPSLPFDDNVNVTLAGEIQKGTPLGAGLFTAHCAKRHDLGILDESVRALRNSCHHAGRVTDYQDRE